MQLNLLEPELLAPSGFRYQAELVTAAEERELVDAFGTLDFRPFEFHGYLGKRRVTSFGMHYDFGKGGLRETASIPDFLLPLRERTAGFAEIDPSALRHALVTEYEPGAPIGWHRDRPVFGDVIGVSLLSSCRFRFRRQKEGARDRSAWERRDIPLERRSVYLMRGPARTEWEHSIPPVEQLRYSVTFRTLRAEE